MNKKIDVKSLNNPSALNDFQKTDKKILTNTKTCSHPSTNECKGDIVQAHTLSKKSMLSKVAENGHVFAPPIANIMKQNFTLKKVGIQDATVFKGFCSIHDKKLFECLDDEPFVCSDKQLFMLAYRSICREYFKLDLTLQRLPKPQNFEKIHGKSNQKFNQNIHDIAETLRVNQESFQYLKEKMDGFLLKESWNELQSKVLIFKIDDKPNIAATGAFIPQFDMDGKSLGNEQLKDWKKSEQNYGIVAVSIIPTEKYYLVIFSYIPEMENATQSLIKSVERQSNKSLAIFNLILTRIENFVLRPSWYDSLTDDEKNLLNQKISSIDAAPTAVDIGVMSKHINWKFCSLRTKLFSKFKCTELLK